MTDENLYYVCDGSGNTIFQIKTIHRKRLFKSNDLAFPIFSLDNKEIGIISKKWSIIEAFSDSDNFSVSFPHDLDVKAKATILGACFLIVCRTLCNHQNKCVYKIYQN